MIQEAFNDMITLLFAKFVLNDAPHAANLLSSSPRVFYHITPKENVPQILREGLYELVHMLTSVTKAHEWQKEVEEHEPAVILRVTLPAEWQVEEDPLHPKGMAVVSKEHIPAEYVSLNDVPHAAGMAAKYEVSITESDGHISAFIPGERASADLSTIEPELLINFGIVRMAKSWYFFNRLINQSGKPGLGTLILDRVLAYCQEHNHSILNEVSAYGNLTQAQLERLYMSRGFKPVNYKMYKNSLLKWEPHTLGHTAPKLRASDIEPPTPAQIRYITNLCMRLKIREPLEENVHTRGEAGRLIRELEARRRAR